MLYNIGYTCSRKRSCESYLQWWVKFDPSHFANGGISLKVERVVCYVGIAIIIRASFKHNKNIQNITVGMRLMTHRTLEHEIETIHSGTRDQLLMLSGSIS